LGTVVELLERECELDELFEALTRAEAGEGSVTVVEGVAGIGKTSLLAALRDRARTTGTRVLSARGAELEPEFSFGIARQLFEPLLRASSETERLALLDGAAGLAGPLLGLTRDSASPPVADLSFALLNALYWLTANLADRAPVLLLLDDVHWADGPSLRWLSFLRARIDELPVAAVMAFRPEARRTELAEFAVNDRNLPACVVRPAPITSAGCATLTRNALGADAASEFCDACHFATGGNPFLLRELLAGLLADGVDPSAQASAAVGGYRSDSVGRWVLARLARLGPDALLLATAVCIFGVEVPIRRAASLAQLDQERAARAADRLIDAEILQPGRPLTFVHAIVRAAVNDQLAPGQRGLLHKQAAATLAAEGAPAEAIVAHLLVTEPAGDQIVVSQLRAAADEAQARGAPESAAAYLIRALEEPAGEDQRPSLLHQLGLAAFLARDPSALDHLAAAHRFATDPRTRAAIALDLAQCLVVVDRLDDVLPLLECAIDELGNLDDELAARLEVQLIFIARLRIVDSGVYHERISRLQTEQLEDSALGRQRMALLVDAAVAEDKDCAVVLELAERAFAAGKLLDELGPESPLFYITTNPVTSANSVELSTLWLDRAIDESRRRGSIVGFALASCSRAVAMFRRGALADAEADARAGLASGGAETGLEGFTIDALSSVLLERGEIDEAETIVLPCAARCEGVDNFPDLFGVYARGRLRIAQGDLRAGLEDLASCRDWLAAFGISARGYLPWASDSALAHLALGERDQAQALARDELETTRRIGEPRMLGIALRTSGLVESDIDRLREAVSVLEDSAARLEHARALVDLGAAMGRAGHRGDARAPLAEGLDLADRCGATVLAGRAREELIGAGARPRRPRISSTDSLTASERRVAQMAHEGMTNREIAQALFVTSATVASHLTHVYQKLDITGREQLAEALAR
jgi:DNA-binding CsgD family transcriptional regulator